MFTAEALIREVAIEGIFNVAEKPQPGNLIFQGTASIRKDRFPAIKRTIALNWVLAILLTLGGLMLSPVTSGQATAEKDAPPGPHQRQPSLPTIPRIPGGWQVGIRIRSFVRS